MTLLKLSRSRKVLRLKGGTDPKEFNDLPPDIKLKILICSFMNLNNIAKVNKELCKLSKEIMINFYTKLKESIGHTDKILLLQSQFGELSLSSSKETPPYFKHLVNLIATIIYEDTEIVEKVENIWTNKILKALGINILLNPGEITEAVYTSIKDLAILNINDYIESIIKVINLGEDRDEDEDNLAAQYVRIQDIQSISFEQFFKESLYTKEKMDEWIGNWNLIFIKRYIEDDSVIKKLKTSLLDKFNEYVEDGDGLEFDMYTNPTTYKFIDIKTVNDLIKFVKELPVDFKLIYNIFYIRE